MSILVDRQLSESLHLRTGLREGNLPALLVRRGSIIDFMGMPIDDRVQPRQLLQDGFTAELLRDGIIVAQMGNQDHIVGAIVPYFVDVLLERLTQPLSGMVSQKVQYRPALLIHDFTDFGFREGIRRDGSDQPDPDLPGIEYAPGLKHRFAVRRAEIGTDISALKRFRALSQCFKSKVKLMIPRHGQVIPQMIHHPDDLSAFGDNADGAPLYGISCINEQDMVIHSLQLLLIQGKAIIADIVLKPHMHVIGMQDHSSNLLRVSGGEGVSRCICGM